MAEAAVLDGAVALSREEEENFIQDNLQYIDRFLSDLKLRETQLPSTSRARINQFKTNWGVSFGNALPDSNVKNPSDSAWCSTGAIPKRKGGSATLKSDAPAGICEQSSSDASDSDSPCDVTSVSESEKIPNRRPRRRGQHANLSQLVERLDRRKMPPMQKFDETSGQDLKKYLRRFEAYCRDNFRGDRDAWADVLQEHLQGRSLETFRSLRGIDDSYDEVRQKLIDWYDEMGEVRRERNKAVFKRARPEPNEAMHIYSNRLQRLYRIAYPSRRIDLSRSLREKYIQTIPRDFQKILKSQILSQKIKEQPVTWKLVQKCARHFDLEKERENSDRDDRGFTVSVANLKKLKDASTQYFNSTVMQPSVDPEHRSSTRRDFSPAAPARATVSRVDARASVPNVTQGREPRPWYADMTRPYTSGMKCFHCKRPGHISRECRLRNNLCFICGSNEHFARQCTRNNNAHDPESRRAPRSSSQPARLEQHPIRRPAASRSTMALNHVAPTRQR